MQQSLQPQLLRLEEALEEAKRAGSTIPDQLQQAILLKCVSGQLRTHLNLAIEEKTTFSELRERVLRWDRSQQRRSSLVFAEGDGSQPMEIDRIYDWNDGGKKGGKGKGKGDQKGKGKGKNKGKSKDGKNGMKGKHKGSDGKGEYGGKTDASKGKGKSVQTCHKCGKPGHFARDCWCAVRECASRWTECWSASDNSDWFTGNLTWPESSTGNPAAYSVNSVPCGKNSVCARCH